MRVISIGEYLPATPQRPIEPPSHPHIQSLHSPRQGHRVHSLDEKVNVIPLH